VNFFRALGNQDTSVLADLDKISQLNGVADDTIFVRPTSRFHVTSKRLRLVLALRVGDVGESETKVEHHVLLQCFGVFAIDDVGAISEIDSGL